MKIDTRHQLAEELRDWAVEIIEDDNWSERTGLYYAFDDLLKCIDNEDEAREKVEEILDMT